MQNLCNGCKVSYSLPAPALLINYTVFILIWSCSQPNIQNCHSVLFSFISTLWYILPPIRLIFLVSSARDCLSFNQCLLLKTILFSTCPLTNIQLLVRVRINYCTSIRQVFYFEEYDTSNLLCECRISSRGQLHSEWQLPHRLSILLLSFHFYLFVTSALSSCILDLVLASS